MGRPRKPVVVHRKGGKRAVVYVRVSTQEQTKGLGPDAQLTACHAYVERMRYEIVATFEDLAKSGTKGRDVRKGLDAALSMCERGEADVLVCSAQDRLARKGGVFDAIRETAISHHFRIEPAREGQDITTDENEMMAQFGSFFAQVEGRLIYRRLLSGRKERAARNGVGTGKPPYGYAKARDKSIVIDEDAARVVRRLFALRRRHTFQRTADALNAEGLSAPRGGQWTPGKVQAIEKHASLYRTGVRQWDGITASERWPIILGR